MQTRRLVLTFALVAAAGCDVFTGSAPRELTGRWETPVQALQPQGSYQTILTFLGRYATIEVRMHGLYSGQRAGDLTAYSRIIARYETAQDTLTFQGEELVSWDLRGTNAREQREKYRGRAPYSGARYEIDADRLTLNYLSYPADAPVPTTMTLFRVE